MKKESKVLLRTAVITFVAFLLIVLASYFIMLFFFTSKLGDFFYSLGCENMSASLYYREYEKNNGIMYVYKALNIEIRQQDNGNIIKYFEDFIGDDEYNDFEKALITKNENSKLDILSKSIQLDEINTINCNYVKALKNNRNIEKAIHVALDNFDKIGDVSLKNIGVYTISYIAEDLDAESDEVSALIDRINDYFNKLLELFNNENIATNSDKSYLLRLGNRIMVVGSDLKEFYATDIEKFQNCIENMEDVNTKIMELI